MATLGSTSTVAATGLALTMIAVGWGVSSPGGFALLLSFAGVLAGTSLIFVGIRMVANNPTAHIGHHRVQVLGDYSAKPLPTDQPMATPGSTSRATATGLFLTLFAVGAGVGFSSGFALLLSFAGVLTGAILIGVRMADDPTATIGLPLVLAARARVRALVQCVHCNLALVGLLLASSAISAMAATAADRDAAPVLCLCAFAVLLLGHSLLYIGVFLGQQEH